MPGLSDGDCIATSLEITTFIDLPKLLGSGSDGGGSGLASSWFRISFPGMDAPDMPAGDGAVSWPDLPKPTLPRLSLSLSGAPFDCGFCGFLGRASRENLSDPLPTVAARPAPKAAQAEANSFLPQGLIDQISGIIWKDRSPPTLGPFALTAFSPNDLLISAEATFSFGDLEVPITAKAKVFREPEIGEGTALVMDMSAKFSNVFGLESVQNVETTVVALRHWKNLQVTLPSCSFDAAEWASSGCSAGAISGERTGDSVYSRVYFAVTIESLDLGLLAQELIFDNIGDGSFELPFQLPTLTDVTLVLAKSFPASGEEYTPSSLSPSILPNDVQLASKDGLWFSTKVEVNSMIPRMIICAIKGIEISCDGLDCTCDVPELQVSAYFEIPGGAPSPPDAPDSLDVSYLRFGFAGLDPPDFDPDPDCPGCTPNGIDLPDLPESARYSINLRGEPYDCGVSSERTPTHTPPIRFSATLPGPSLAASLIIAPFESLALAVVQLFRLRL